jgi:hypothetical protein
VNGVDRIREALSADTIVLKKPNDYTGMFDEVDAIVLI